MSPSSLGNIVTDVRMTALAVLLMISGCGSPTNKYGPIVTAIANGTLSVPASGVVALPAKWKSLTPNGVVNVERRPDGRLFILFPTFYGRGDDLDGWLYCSGPLTPADYYTINWGPGGNHQHIDACGSKMLTVSSMASPWYGITRRLE